MEALNEVDVLRKYNGTMSNGKDKINVMFDASIDKSGNVVLKIEDIKLTKESWFIKDIWHNKDEEHFHLDGQSDDGVSFKTEELKLYALRTIENSSFIRLEPNCLSANFSRNIDKNYNKPILKMYLIGIKCLCNIASVYDPLGVVKMIKMKDNEVSSIIGLYATEFQEDTLVWKSEAKKLLEHILTVMSFAYSIHLIVPYTAFCDGDKVNIDTISILSHNGISMPIIQCPEMQSFFKAVISSFPQFSVKNLWGSMIWFTMPTTQKEVLLISAMMAIEVLIDSNLGKEDKDILKEKKFGRLRKEFKQVIHNFLDEENNNENMNDIKDALNEKLCEVNHFSLLSKTFNLMNKWEVPIDDIKDKFRDAIKARNNITHKGIYYLYGNEKNLWNHIDVLRELIARIVMTLIGYSGWYITYIDGPRRVEFQPLIDDNKGKNN